MAQDNTVSFKAYLLQGDANVKSEVRRFGVYRDVVSSFDYLKEKLQHVFPALRGQSFSVMWKDSDNDDVVISSDDELMIALSEMQTEVRKLYIKLLGDTEHPNAKAGKMQETTGQMHMGVICDECDLPIKDFRYHCTECLDYDLCGTCEAKKVHGEHIMIRLPKPLPLPVFPFLEHLEHIGEFKERHGFGRRHHHDKHARGKYQNKTFSEKLIDMFGQEQESSAEKGKQNEGLRDKMKTKYEKHRKTHSKKADYLYNVGQRIAEFLDPFGIDVDVEVLTKNNDKEKEENKGEEKMETEEIEKDKVQNKEAESNVGEASNEAGPSQAPEAQAPNSAAQSVEGSPETDDWTVVNAAVTQQQELQENQSAADLEQQASGSTSDTSDEDQTSVIEVKMDELHMASDSDVVVEEIYIAGSCSRGRKRKTVTEWKKKSGHKKDIGNRKKHGHKGSDSECRKKHGYKHSESRKKFCHKRSISGNRQKYGHRSHQNCVGNPPQQTETVTSGKQAQDGAETVLGVPAIAGPDGPVYLIGTGVSSRQLMTGDGEYPLTTGASASKYAGAGPSAEQVPVPSSTGASAPMYAASANQILNGAGMPSTNGASTHLHVGPRPSANQILSGAGMPSTTGASAPMYAFSANHILNGVGLPSSTGASAPMYAASASQIQNGTGMPSTSGATAPIYTRPGAYVLLPSVTSRVGGRAGAAPSNLPRTYESYTSPYPVYPWCTQNNRTSPHVASAVQKMMAMGFSNEGGWLTQLLEFKNGDIEKALDVLQPVKRS